MQKRLSTFFICLLLLSALASAFHHHDDGADHPECSICLAGHQQSDAGYPAPGWVIQSQPVEIIHARPVSASPAKTFRTPANNRAPPA